MTKRILFANAAVLLLAASFSLPVWQPEKDASSHHNLSSFTDAGSGRLHRAIQSLGSQDPAVLFADIGDTLVSDIKIPKNVTLVHLGGSTIHLGGHDLMVAGAFVAAQARVFSGDGVVRFRDGSVSQILPQWWGENNSLNVQKALTAAAQCGAELFLPAGTYRFDTTAKWLFTEVEFLGRSLSVRGEGPGRTIINNQTAGRPAFLFDTQDALTQQGWFLSIEGLEVRSPEGTGSSGIEIGDVWNGRIDNCLVSGQELDGILMRADLNDFGQPKTWTIQNCVLVRNGRYGINLAAPGDNTVSYNMTLDHLNIELNAMGGIYAAAELSQITHCLISNNGVGPASHGGIYMTGISGYRVYENVIADCGFEANAPYDIYADRVANLTIARNDHSRVQMTNGQSQQNFIRLDGPQGALNVTAEHNQYSSGIQSPFTAIKGGPGLVNMDLDNNRFNLPLGNKRVDFASTTKATRRTLGDTMLTNQTIQFANKDTGIADVTLRRGGPGILAVGGVASDIQPLTSDFGTLQIDCAQGLTVTHTLSENTMVLTPLKPASGAMITLVVFQPFASSHSIDFAPIFKKTGPFTASGLHFSTIRFVYTGQYWVQVGAAAIDAPL